MGESLNRGRAIAIGVGIAAVCAGLFAAAMSIRKLESVELDSVGEAIRVAEQPDTLMEAELRAGEDVTFEICTSDAFRDPSWLDLVVFGVLYEEPREAVHARSLDTEALSAVRRNAIAGCMTVAEGNEIPIGGKYLLVAEWTASSIPISLRDETMWGRVTATPPRSSIPRWPPWLVLCGIVTMGIALGIDIGQTEETTESRSTRPGRSVAAGLAAFMAAFFGTAFIPIGGAFGTLIRGMLIAVTEIGVAIVLARSTESSRTTALAARFPPRWWLWKPAAFLAGVLCWFAGGFFSMWFPSTSEAPVEAIVAFPSGSIAVAIIGVLVPLAEEIYFRGFLYGALEKLAGSWLAFALVVVLFAVIHLPQTYGAWGAFASIAFLGFVLTLLRRASGSLPVCILAHLTHNAMSLT